MCVIYKCFIGLGCGRVFLKFSLFWHVLCVCAQVWTPMISIQTKGQKRWRAQITSRVGSGSSVSKVRRACVCLYAGKLKELLSLGELKRIMRDDWVRPREELSVLCLASICLRLGPSSCWFSCIVLLLSECSYGEFRRCIYSKCDYFDYVCCCCLQPTRSENAHMTLSMIYVHFDLMWFKYSLNT